MADDTKTGEDKFPIGSLVKVNGLVSAPHHNGKLGVVSGMTADRIAVQLDGGETIGALVTVALKPKNLELITDADAVIPSVLQGLRNTLAKDTVVSCAACGAIPADGGLLDCARCLGKSTATASAKKRTGALIKKNVM